MTAGNNHFIVKAKGLCRAGMSSQKVCYLSIRDGMIQAISDGMPDCSGDEIVDLSHLVISPCFCDYHLHFSEQAKTASDSISAELLRYGIVLAYEGGDRELTGLFVREDLKGMPKIITSGYALYKKGGYGKAIGRAVQNPEEAFAAINELQSFPVDYIKLINSGVYLPESDRISAGGFDAAEIRRIAEYATGERS